MKQPSSINSIFKTFRLVEIFHEPNFEYSLTEISKKVNITIGSAQRITNSLIAIGYLVKDKKTKKFRLTPKWLPIGFGVLAGLEIRNAALPHLKRLYKETGETVSLVLRDGDEVIYIERLITPDLLGMTVRVGIRRPMYPNSMGKAILAFLPDDEKNAILERLALNNKGKESFNEAEIKLELDKIKRQGYAINKVQSSGGALAISVPILNYKGKAFAGINIGMSSNSPPDNKKFKEFVQLLMNTGRAISAAIGYRDFLEE
jgi:DNA-binding IclR family transcriptional regulator